MFAEFAARAGLPGGAALPAVAGAVQAIPHGRLPVRTPDGVLRAWCGTCPARHAALASAARASAL